jgi:hypothetical protein
LSFKDNVCAFSSDEQVFGIHIGLFAGYTIVDSLALLKSEQCVSSFLQDKVREKNPPVVQTRKCHDACCHQPASPMGIVLVRM